MVFNAVFASPAQPHDFWLEPSSYRPAVESPITVSFREGQGAGEALPRNESRLFRFELIGPTRTEAVSGVDGAHPAGAVSGLDAGQWVVVYANTPAPHTLPAARFESYLEEKGLEHVVVARARRGETEMPGRERFYRCAKTMLAVGGGGSGGEPTGPTGLTLELVPLVAMAALRPGEELPVQVMFRGAPLPGLLVSVMAREAGPAMRHRSDERGIVRFPIERDGRFRLQAVHMVDAPPGVGVDWESWWASLTFDVAAE